MAPAEWCAAEAPPPDGRGAAPPCGRLLQPERSSYSIVTSGSASKPSKPAKAAASSSAAVGLGLGIGLRFGFGFGLAFGFGFGFGFAEPAP